MFWNFAFVERADWFDAVFCFECGTVALEDVEEHQWNDVYYCNDYYGNNGVFCVDSWGHKHSYAWKVEFQTVEIEVAYYWVVEDELLQLFWAFIHSIVKFSYN